MSRSAQVRTVADLNFAVDRDGPQTHKVNNEKLSAPDRIHTHVQTLPGVKLGTVNIRCFTCAEVSLSACCLPLCRNESSKSRCQHGAILRPPSPSHSSTRTLPAQHAEIVQKPADRPSCTDASALHSECFWVALAMAEGTNDNQTRQLSSPGSPRGSSTPIDPHPF